MKLFSELFSSSHFAFPMMGRPWPGSTSCGAQQCLSPRSSETLKKTIQPNRVELEFQVIGEKLIIFQNGIPGTDKTEMHFPSVRGTSCLTYVLLPCSC